MVLFGSPRLKLRAIDLGLKCQQSFPDLNVLLPELDKNSQFFQSAKIVCGSKNIR